MVRPKPAPEDDWQAARLLDQIERHGELAARIASGEVADDGVGHQFLLQRANRELFIRLQVLAPGD